MQHKALSVDYRKMTGQKGSSSVGSSSVGTIRLMDGGKKDKPSDTVLAFFPLASDVATVSPVPPPEPAV